MRVNLATAALLSSVVRGCSRDGGGETSRFAEFDFYDYQPHLHIEHIQPTRANLCRIDNRVLCECVYMDALGIVNGVNCVQCTMFILYSVHCTLYIVHRTLYTKNVQYALRRVFISIILC